MDSKAHLDYALFQLTPTRTRCDLVVFSGKKSEKVASGLVEPFIAHLKYAKDHIPKGGYSITLRPPATPDDPSWFTKATFERFVRFVSTPEILERIIRIESEISQIESSIQSSDIPNLEETGHPGEESLSNIKKATNSSKSTSEDEDHWTAPRENSRVRLQRLMDTRKALLQKEQAMAYARAVVAGYEIDTIDDLICFADTFGASRLREACSDFKELYKKKHSDDQWMDELAAVQACPMTDLLYMGTSGINIHGNATLSDSNSTPTSSDRTKAPEQTPNVQQQMPWMNQIPPYMYNFRGPIQQIPAYYPYYPSHMGWSSPGGIVPSKNHKSPRKKEKSFDANGTSDASEEDEQTASSESDEKKEHDKKHPSNEKKHVFKKNKTKGSKTVVIRNINYITSQRRNGEESEIPEDSSSGDDNEASSIREGVENAIASLEKHAHSKAPKNRGKQGTHAQNGSNFCYSEHENKNYTDSNISEGGKANNAWNAFQNLLMSHEESYSNELPKHDPGDEHFAMNTSNGGLSPKTSNIIDDSVLMIQREGANGGKAHMVDFANGEDIYSSSKKIVSDDDNALFAEQYKGSRTNLPDFSAEQTAIKNRKEEDWFIVNNSSGNPETQGAKKLEFANGSYERSFIQKETTVVDDSFIIESRSAVDERYVSHWRTDINIDADIDMPKPEKGSPTISSPVEPDDLCMVLVRESRESGAMRTPEMDYEVEISFSEADKRSSVIESNGHGGNDPVANGENADNKKKAGPKMKKIGRDVSRTLSGSLARSKLDSVSKSKVSPAMVQKSKLKKEEEERKRTEELRIQRQKRIAERTAASGLTSAACKKLPVGNKSTPRKTEKNRSPSTVQKLSLAKPTA